MADHDLSQSAHPIDTEERAYLLKRADDHRQLAAESAEPGARSLHIRFQQLYLERARGEVSGTSEPEVPAKTLGTWPANEG